MLSLPPLDSMSHNYLIAGRIITFAFQLPPQSRNSTANLTAAAARLVGKDIKDKRSRAH
jgi:hypothetical protein